MKDNNLTGKTISVDFKNKSVVSVDEHHVEGKRVKRDHEKIHHTDIPYHFEDMCDSAVKLLEIAHENFTDVIENTPRKEDRKKISETYLKCLLEVLKEAKISIVVAESSEEFYQTFKKEEKAARGQKVGKGPLDAG